MFLIETKRFFFKNQFIIILILINLKTSEFSCRQLHAEDRNDIFRKNIVWYPFYSKFAIFTDVQKLQEFFYGKPNFFSEVLSYVFVKSYYSVRFHGKFATIGWSKTFNVNMGVSTGKWHLNTNRTIFSGWVSPCYEYGRNNKIYSNYYRSSPVIHSVGTVYKIILIKTVSCATFSKKTSECQKSVVCDLEHFGKFNVRNSNLLYFNLNKQKPELVDILYQSSPGRCKKSSTLKSLLSSYSREKTLFLPDKSES